jgi:hypothetical protein
MQLVTALTTLKNDHRFAALAGLLLTRDPSALN